LVIFPLLGRVTAPPVTVFTSDIFNVSPARSVLSKFKVTVPSVVSKHLVGVTVFERTCGADFAMVKITGEETD
jgi:hypothetical protein